MTDKIKILYIDDEWFNLTSFYAYFRIQKEFDIYVCQNPSQGLDILKKENIHVVIADQKMPELSGVEFLEQAELNAPVPVKIVVTAYNDIAPLEKAFEEGIIFKYFQKPFNMEEIKVSIQQAYEIYLKSKL
jgi:response regulator RpfG family c-di-GMP phosphodiesterase